MPNISKTKWILDRSTGKLVREDVYLSKRRKAELKGIFILSFIFAFMLSVTLNIVLIKENRYQQEQINIYESMPDYNGFQD
mgnify:CR=1 FL=1